MWGGGAHAGVTDHSREPALQQHLLETCPPPIPPTPTRSNLAPTRTPCALVLQASASVEVRPEEGPVRLSDVQNLVLWVLGEGSNPRWCFVKVGGWAGGWCVQPLFCGQPL